MQLLTPLLALLASSASCSKITKPAEVKLIESDSEVFKGEGIHVQCLVTYHDPQLLDDIIVEFTRLTNSSAAEALSQNGEVVVQAPQGQKYAAYVVNSGQHAQEHAFRIENIDIHSDSGVYKCQVRLKDKILDVKQVKINVVTDPAVVYEMMPTTKSFNTLHSKRTTTDIGQNQDLTCQRERVLQQNLKNSKRLTGPVAEHQLSLSDIEDPVVCFPRFHREPVIKTKIGESVSLPCRAEAMPTPKITWYKEEQHGLEQIHADDEAFIVIDEFGDFFLQVNLDLNQVKPSDFGTYICSAKNQHGQDAMKISLIEEPSDVSGGASRLILTSFMLILCVVIIAVLRKVL